MNTLKRKNMMATYEGFRGYQTVSAIQRQIPHELVDRLTGHELGIVMDAISTAYLSGRASHYGIEAYDDAVWIPWGGGEYLPEEHLPGSVVPKTGENGQLIPIEALRRIKINDRHYTLDYREE